MSELLHRIFGHQQRPWGYEVRADVWDESDNHYPICMTWPNEPTETQIDTEVDRRIVNLQAELDFNAIEGKELGQDFGFELAEHFKEVLIELIKAVRNNNDITLVQLEAGFNNKYPDSIFSFNRFVKFLRKKIGGEVTFAQFKTYVINKKFREVE